MKIPIGIFPVPPGCFRHPMGAVDLIEEDGVAIEIEVAAASGAPPAISALSHYRHFVRSEAPHTGGLVKFTALIVEW